MIAALFGLALQVFSGQCQSVETYQIIFLFNSLLGGTLIQQMIVSHNLS